MSTFNQVEYEELLGLLATVTSPSKPDASGFNDRFERLKLVHFCLKVFFKTRLDLYEHVIFLFRNGKASFLNDKRRNRVYYILLEGVSDDVLKKRIAWYINEVHKAPREGKRVLKYLNRLKRRGEF